MRQAIDRGYGPDAEDDPPFRQLTRDEAQALRERHPPLSPWRVVAAQAVVGLLAAALAWALTGSGGVTLSALYGAAVTALPSALLASGMTRRRLNAVTAAAGFLFWEMVKIGVAIAMLAVAPKVVPDLSWPALLAAMVAGIVVNWFALLWQSRAVRAKTKN